MIILNQNIGDLKFSLHKVPAYSLSTGLLTPSDRITFAGIQIKKLIKYEKVKQVVKFFVLRIINI
jgi:hypothetical protein